MTSTTSLKLTDELKAQIAEAAKSRGKTAHALMIDVLQQAMDEARMEDDFYREAMQAQANMVTSNMAYSFDEITKLVRARVKGDRLFEPHPHAVNPHLPMRADLHPLNLRKAA